MSKTKQTSRFYKYVSMALVIAVLLFIIVRGEEYHTRYLVHLVSPSVVKLYSDESKRGGGTGFGIIAPSGLKYTLSNAHVCEMGKQGYLVSFSQTLKTNHRVRVLAIDTVADLCILEGIPGVPGLTIGDDVKPFESAMIIGHPYLLQTTLSRGQVGSIVTINLITGVNLSPEDCKGEYHALNNMFITNYFNVSSVCVSQFWARYTNIVVYPGNSGSPTVDFWGNVVGVLFASDSRTHYGYLVPLVDVKTFIKGY